VQAVGRGDGTECAGAVTAADMLLLACASRTWACGDGLHVMSNDNLGPEHELMKIQDREFWSPQVKGLPGPQRDLWHRCLLQKSSHCPSIHQSLLVKV
jgi:hypothetical protein